SSLMAILSNDEKTDLLLLSSRYNQLKGNERMGIISATAANTQRNQITLSVLSYMSEMDSELFVEGRRPRQPDNPSDSWPSVSSGGQQLTGQNKDGNYTGPKKVFIAYAREDTQYVERLTRFLTPLQNQGLLTTWAGLNIPPGEHRQKEIEKNLQTADIILFMVSVDFLHSASIRKTERRLANELVKKRSAIIVPIIVRPCLWNQEEFAKYEATPRDNRGNLIPISKWESQDEANFTVVNALKRLLPAY
ncbi:MAG: TIR domain-containing protein, partial [Bacteroidota bacterium]